MNSETYVQEALRTESLDHFKVDQPRLLHAAIGLNTEFAELILASRVNDEVNIKEELGDMLWYLAIAADALGVSFHNLRVLADRELIEECEIAALLTATGGVLDVVKRAVFYGTDFDEALFGKHLGTILIGLEAPLKEYGWTQEEVQASNIAKLKRRFPEKFTTEAAVNRDLDAEMEAVGS